MALRKHAALRAGVPTGFSTELGPGKTKEEVIAAIRKCDGLLQLTADRLKWSKRHLQRAILHYDLTPIVRECQGRILDTAEARLHAALRKSAPWAIMFFLRTKGRKRGYVEASHVRQETIDRTPRQQGPTLADLDLPVEVRRAVVDALRKREALMAGQPAPVVIDTPATGIIPTSSGG